MDAEPRNDAEAAGAACAPPGVAVGVDGTELSTTGSACLPKSGTVDGWQSCASCGLPQAPGKEFCAFCGRRWVSAS